MNKTKKKFLYGTIGVILIITIFFLIIPKNPKLSDVVYIKEKISVYSCQNFNESGESYAVSIPFEENDKFIDVKCKDKTISFEFPKGNLNSTFLVLEGLEDPYSYPYRIKKELLNLEEISNYFQKEYSYECTREINYLYTSFSDYGRKISSELEKEIGIELEQVYGQEKDFTNFKKCGKVYFLMIKHGEWDSVRYWAVEMNAETGELLKWKEVTSKENYVNRSKLWWID